jgi:hypothetical protein
LLITRIVRDDDAIAQAEALVEDFLREVEAQLTAVNELYPEKAAA